MSLGLPPKSPTNALGALEPFAIGGRFAPARRSAFRCLRIDKTDPLTRQFAHSATLDKVVDRNEAPICNRGIRSHQ